MSAAPSSPCRSDQPSDGGSDQAMLAMVTSHASIRSASLSKLSASPSNRELLSGNRVWNASGRSIAAWFLYSPTLEICAASDTG